MFLSLNFAVNCNDKFSERHLEHRYSFTCKFQSNSCNQTWGKNINKKWIYISIHFSIKLALFFHSLHFVVIATINSFKRTAWKSTPSKCNFQDIIPEFKDLITSLTTEFFASQIDVARYSIFRRKNKKFLPSKLPCQFKNFPSKKNENLLIFKWQYGKYVKLLNLKKFNQPNILTKSFFYTFLFSSKYYKNFFKWI